MSEYGESITLHGKTYNLEPVTLALVKRLSKAEADFDQNLILGSLIAGGHADMTFEQLEEMPYVEVYKPLHGVMLRVNGLEPRKRDDQGEAPAAPEETAAASATIESSTPS